MSGRMLNRIRGRHCRNEVSPASEVLESRLMLSATDLVINGNGAGLAESSSDASSAPLEFHWLVLIYKNVQLPDISAAMDQATIDTLVHAVQVDLPNMVNQLAGTQIQVRVHVEVIDRPLSGWAKAADNHYESIPESSISQELDEFSRPGWYDHVMVCHGLVDDQLGPTAWWGGGIYRDGMSFASLNFSPTNNTVLNEDAVPGMIHEWIHGLESQYFGARGVTQGLDPQGGGLDLHDGLLFGYTHTQNGRPGWEAWYQDFLTDHIHNYQSDGSDTGLGLGPDAWATGLPRLSGTVTPGSPLSRPDVSLTANSFLSDLYWAKSVGGSLGVQRDIGLGGSALKVNGATYSKGVSLEAPGEIVVDTRARAEWFESEIGIGDEVASNSGSVVFKVIGDGKVLFQSGVLTGASAAQKIRVNVLGIQELKLVVESTGDGSVGDHAVWGNAIFTPFAGDFISDIPWTNSSTEWGAVRSDKETDGKTLTVNGVSYGKGVGIHAHGEIIIPLDQRYSMFHAYVGLDDGSDLYGTVSFQVYVDGVLKFDSGVMNGSTPAKLVEVSCFNASTLKLVINDGGDGINSDHGVWGEAYLLPEDRSTAEEIAAFRAGTFYLDQNNSRSYNSGDAYFTFGTPGDLPVSGDWNGNGVVDVGVYRSGRFYLDANGSRSWNTGDVSFAFGTTGDIPVSGDWNGDGITDVGVYRSGKFYLDANGTRTWNAGDVSFAFGIAGDVPVIGDWNGDGVSDVGVFRSGRFYLDANGSRSWNTGDVSIAFGTAGDKPISGDWNGDGITDVGVARSGKFYVDSNGSRSWNAGDTSFSFGNATDIPVAGLWKLPSGAVAIAGASSQSVAIVSDVTAPGVATSIATTTVIPTQLDTSKGRLSDASTKHHEGVKRRSERQGASRRGNGNGHAVPLEQLDKTFAESDLLAGLLG